MKKVKIKNYKMLIAGFGMCVLSYASFSSEAEAKRNYFDAEVYGEFDRDPEDGQCLSAISKCISDVCMETSQEKIKLNGLYSKCYRYSKAQTYEYIESCLSGYENKDKMDYIPYCSRFVVDEVNVFLANQGTLNDNFKNNSFDCQGAKYTELASAKCFNFVQKQQSPFSGQILQQLYSLCGSGTTGGNNQIAEEYFYAGNYSAVETAQRGLVSGSKMIGWKDVASGIAASYKSKKIIACGGDEFAMPEIIDNKSRIKVQQIDNIPAANNKSWYNIF